MRAGCLLLALIAGLGWAGQALAQPRPVILSDLPLPVNRAQPASATPASAQAMPAPTPTPAMPAPTLTPATTPAPIHTSAMPAPTLTKPAGAVDDVVPAQFVRPEMPASYPVVRHPSPRMQTLSTPQPILPAPALASPPSQAPPAPKPIMTAPVATVPQALPALAPVVPQPHAAHRLSPRLGQSNPGEFLPPILPPPRPLESTDSPSVQPLPRPSDTPNQPPVPAPVIEALPVIDEPPPLLLPRWYAEAEFLQWWIQGSRLPPLITSSPVGTLPGDAGILGNPGTLVLFGDQSVSGDVHKGARATVGYLLAPVWGLSAEVSYFGLTTNTDRYNQVSSRITGTPTLARPFVSILDGPAAELVNFIGVVSGDVVATVRSSAQGVEALLRQDVPSLLPGWTTQALVGYRLLQLTEQVSISQGAPLVLTPTQLFPNFVLRDDNFQTRSDFHGLQLGLANQCQRGKWLIDLVGKVALGSSFQNVFVDGRNTSTALGGLVLPGGLLAQPSNLGSRNGTDFAVAPEVLLKLRYQFAANAEVSLGYTLLYWSAVVRPADQLDLVINTTQLNGGQLIGPARPFGLVNRSDLFIQGISFGLAVRF